MADAKHVIKIGAARVHRVEELTFKFPMELLTRDADVLRRHEQWLLPNFMDPDRCTFDFSCHSWLVQVDGRTVLVDPCNGNGRVRPVLRQFDHLNTPYIERFEATGVRPDEVDFVFCTHMHCDHCGWNTQLRDGQWIPTFPKARYLFVRREYERWRPDRPEYVTVDYNVGVFEDSVRPIMEAGLADLVPGIHRVSSSVTIEPAYGHTFGHSMLHLISNGTEAYFCGDAFHHPLQLLYPELHLPGCDDLTQAIVTRRELRDLCAERNAVLLPAHFSAPHAGRVSRTSEGYQFQPLWLV
jgi:glyoxylase-like metal-dependent hydrolase (beta-lactamase superfamily II)